MLITSAQGQLMTRKVKARYSQMFHSAGRPRISPLTSGGRIANASALYTTAGV